ncbi:MAG TPA: type III-A CRISPR-associated RAMP protein Csm3 [Fervidobacterium sp.]|nr:type III-A CRISPR-associated RAMP protein Csm3 [Fervidobacterium sp.]HOK88027.1 type III-A CRISPR-associated RAMP protein Csm3 [Fervidobacterium sp.]HUM76343.1 type III-A CRISPR-associated RAMP protein Csm3 [Fervidobacterium sp.]
MEKLFLNGKFVVSCDAELLTGLHIGSGAQTLEIGGIDNPVIKDSLGRPYIPGSSLKGKMRTLMEFYHEKVEAGKLIVLVDKKENVVRMHMCDDENCEVCNLFGRNHGIQKTLKSLDSQNLETTDEGQRKNVIPTRLIVRDAYLIEDSITEEMHENLDTLYTEAKSENSIDRITSSANPRVTERIPAGAKFKVEFVVNQYEISNNKVKSDGTKYLKELIIAMRLLENDYLGGSGSRGYGKIAFKDIKIEYRDKNYYESGKEPKCTNFKELKDINPDDLDNLLKDESAESVSANQ